MTARSMADDSSEQVPGQQTGESSVKDPKPESDENGGDDKGLGRDASAG